MKTAKPPEPDARLDVILNFVSELASGNVPVTLTDTQQDDALDQIMAQLNVVAERLVKWEGGLRAKAEERLNELTEVMMSVASLNFERRATIGDTQDIFDGLAIGLNMLSEELQAEIVRRQQTEAALRQRTTDLETSNRIQQEQQAKLVASEKMASLGRLTAGMAHEMNTPLAAVRASLQELDHLIQEYQAGIDDPALTPDDHREIAAEMQRAVQLADSGTERVAQFVRGIKSQTRDLEPHERVRFLAAPAIQEALSLLAHALRQGNCTADFEAPDDEIELYSSPARLAQVVTNLVMNAIDASAPKGGPIILRLRQDPTGVELRVSDTGQGISSENLSRIFDPMFTTKPFGESTGLGLTIVYDIVTGDFGGTIEVVSQPGQGATFILHFPNPAQVPHGS
jgi:signal transduction histidine kinase